MEEVQVKVTWRLAWSLYWRIMLISLGIYVVIVLPIMLIFGVFAAFGSL